MFAVFLHCTVVLCVVVMSHPQPSLSGTGVLCVSTGTDRCVDPPRQGGGQQYASSCVVWIVVAVHSEVVIFKHLIKGKKGQNEKR